MTINYQFLYEEFEGTLTALNDPSGAGSQADTYTYKAGQGTDLREKHEKFTMAQDENSVRPITVNVRPPGNEGPGVITGTIFAQALKQSVDYDEDAAMMLADGGGAITSSDREKWITAKAAYFDMPTDSQFVVTDEMQAQLLDAIPNAHMPNTRAALIEALSIDGSRSQEMYGFQVTLDDLRAAEDWRMANKPGSPSLYT